MSLFVKFLRRQHLKSAVCLLGAVFSGFMGVLWVWMGLFWLCFAVLYYVMFRIKEKSGDFSRESFF
ncbi:MAG: hypothetical protein ACPLRY_08165, partial [Candidatus Bathyarchaeales archaeon]